MAAKKILVVDPDPALAALVTRILEEEGYEVTTVESLEEAIALLTRSTFDLIITEAFDQSDQFDFDPSFLAKLKQVAPAPPIILSSTYPSTDLLHAGDFGLAEVVPKPFDLDDLLQKVSRLKRS